jgi:hypothetical protein
MSFLRTRVAKIEQKIAWRDDNFFTVGAFNIQRAPKVGVFRFVSDCSAHIVFPLFCLLFPLLGRIMKKRDKKQCSLSRLASIGFDR